MVWRTLALVSFTVVIATTSICSGVVAADNEVPLADAGLDQRVEQGTSVLLDGNGSRDPDGELDSYRWRIETPSGDEIRPECADCARTRFLADETGRYEVTIVIEDTAGDSATDTLYVTVSGDENSEDGDPDSPPSPVPPTTTNPIGLDTVTHSSSSESCTDGCGTDGDSGPWIEVNGPSEVAVDQSATFTIKYGGFDSDPTFGWSISGRGTTATTSWNSVEEETIFVSAATDNQTLHTVHDVTVVDNQKPIVDIEAPDTFHPGEEVTLAADVSDPDGRVVSTEWSEGPTIRVPEGSGTKTVTVTATDDDQATSIDEISIKSSNVESNTKQTTSATQTVYCYYDQRSERMRQSPDHCEIVNSDQSDDRDGYQSLNGNIDRMLRSPKFNIIWKKTEKELKQHSGDIADEKGNRMPDVEDNDGTTPVVPALDSSQLRAIRGDTISTESDSFELNGNSVENDVNDDGKVNAIDWDSRFGSSQKTVREVHRGVIGQLRDAQRANRRAQRGGGPRASTSDPDTSLPSSLGVNAGLDQEDSSRDSNSKMTNADRGENIAHNAVDQTPGSSGTIGAASNDESTSDSSEGSTELNGIDASLPDDMPDYRTSNDRASEIGRKAANRDVI